MSERRERPLVIMADDDIEIRRILKRTVSTLDCDIMQAEDGEQGLEMIIEHQPDLVVLDVMMPTITVGNCVNTFAVSQHSNTPAS